MSHEAGRILVVDDEASVRKLLRIGLSSHDYEVIEAGDGAEALRLAVARAPRLVILDLGLPDMDGVDVVRRLREWSAVPVIVLSARDREDDKIGALDAGADDYVTKPFSVAELLARIRVALRRAASPDGAPVFEHNGLRVDHVERRVSLDGAAVALTRKEYALLSELVRHAGRVLTHTHLLRAVWGPGHEHDTQYLRVFVRQLREKLHDDPAQPRWIATESGVGYRWLVNG
ncbi:two-component system KDP operon response regulator KdpE [Panacagrimonas perspica]|uniref:Two-component system KDP operon response regulator KdpE n=1 Tax=Panacagrimonas perspica TaxID=381431 RepID=A0A4S3K2T1_9GAMM|nr:response regulator transcription factor [Panacagrimonas perspica]TDU28849.1 two-component system KDP operon response regulator KdpE [Panacagrimonas perspica]THD02320.1 DNA-binding response regulator [Panacagrimonas perspica]